LKLLSSLTNRIFLATALLAVLSIAFAIYVVNATVTREAEAELRRGLEEAGILVEEHRATLFDTYTRLAGLVADLPRLKAAVTTDDPATVEPIANEYHKQVRSDLFVVTDRTGRVFAAIGRSEVPSDSVATLPAVQRALTGTAASSFWPHPEGVLQVVTVPLVFKPSEIVGTLSVGFLFDDQRTIQFKAVTESEIALAAGGEVLASTLPHVHGPQLAALVRQHGASALVPSVQLGDDDYVALLRPMASSAPGQHAAIGAVPGTDPPIAVILRSRSQRLKFLSTIHTGLAVTAIVAVLAATLLSYAIARTMTQPLGTITAAMREMAKTGDLTRKIALSRRRWDDEDARLLATTFNTLTDSIDRFQREVSQRERLSSLGRLSTVIAHEIRNPLMIIKASLRTVARENTSPHERAEAVTDIDEEIGRLNRVVNDVLDFARPIRFDCRPVDLNRLCADAAAATAAGEPTPTIVVHPDPEIGEVVCDGERLRLVLVNMLTNARDAVVEPALAATADAGPATGSARRGTASTTETTAASARHPASAAVSAPPPAIEIATERIGDDRVAIVVRDRGGGIAPQDLARVFDPYFTTRRTGSGLGLPIAKNIIEGLGGSIAIKSGVGKGTEIRMVLPRVCRSS
jgi:signal transduction histidine kinase